MLPPPETLKDIKGSSAITGVACKGEMQSKTNPFTITVGFNVYLKLNICTK